jgi:hypothetical protein
MQRQAQTTVHNLFLTVRQSHRRPQQGRSGDALISGVADLRRANRESVLVAATTNLLSTTVLRRLCALAHQDARRLDVFHRRAITVCLLACLAASMLGFIAVRHPLEAGRRHPSRPSL